ncbi:chemotaxis protein CheB [Microcoleus sp. B7-D4]|uniref:chemotaxis protein CheB n=1 Tax=Microcoleus sp. B7-D4 TaxID=2818696 RepID=UPI002FD5561E
MTNVLCIGGSTLNRDCQPGIIEDLKMSGIFKNNWAVIIAIHKYLLMYDQLSLCNKTVFREKRRTDLCEAFAGLNFVLLEASGEYTVKPGDIYILPDSLYYKKNPDDDNLIYLKIQIFMKKDNLVINVSEVVRKMINSNSHFSEESVIREEESAGESVSNSCAEDQSIPDLEDLPHIDDVMTQIAHNNREQTAGLLLAGMGDDGAEGMLIIHQQGGVTAVQAPDNCIRPPEYPDRDNGEMPRKAIDLANQTGFSHDIICLQEQGQESCLRQWLTTLHDKNR